MAAVLTCIPLRMQLTTGKKYCVLELLHSHLQRTQALVS